MFPYQKLKNFNFFPAGFIAEGVLPDFIVDRLTAIKRQQVKKTNDDSFDGSEKNVPGMFPSIKLNASLEDEDENSDSSTSASNGDSTEKIEKSRFADAAEREIRCLAGKKKLKFKRFIPL